MTHSTGRRREFNSETKDEAIFECPILHLAQQRMKKYITLSWSLRSCHVGGYLQNRQCGLGSGYNGQSGKIKMAFYQCESAKLFRIPESVAHLQNGDNNEKLTIELLEESKRLINRKHFVLYLASREKE